MENENTTFGKKFVLGLTLAFIFTLTFLTRFGEVVNYTITYASQIVVGVIFAIFLIVSIRKKNPIKVDFYLIIFILAIGFSIVFSQYKYHAFAQFFNFFFASLVALLILNLFNSKNFKLMLNFIVITGFLFGFISYLFYYSYAFAHFPTLSLYAQKYAFVSFDVVHSLWQYNNSFGAFLILPAFISLGLFFEETSEVKKLLYLIVSIFLTFLIIITSSRGSYIAYAFTLVIFPIIARKNFWKAIFYEILVVISALFLTPILASQFTIDVILNKNTQLSEFVQGEQNVSLYMRIYFVKLSIQRFLQNPFKPIGIGSFRDFYSMTATLPDKIRFDPHSLVARILVETGIYGIVAFIAYIFNVYSKALKSLKLKNFSYYGLLAGTSGFFLHMCMDVESLLPITLVYLFVGFALLSYDNVKEIRLNKNISIILAIALFSLSVFLTPKLIASISALKGNNTQGSLQNYFYSYATSLDPGNATYHFLVGLNLKNENVDKALSEFKIGASLNPLDYRFPLAIGTILLDTKSEIAIDYIEKASSLRKNDLEIKGLVAIAYILIKNNFAMGKTISENTLKEDENLSNSNIAYGMVLLNEGKLDLARDYIVKGIKSNPKNPYGQLALAFYYSKLNESYQVKERFKYLKMLDPILERTYESTLIINSKN